MNFKAYDILSSLVPGFIVLMVLLNFVNIEYNKDWLIPYTAFAFLLGFVINTVSCWLEDIYYCTWGGKPSNRLLDGKSICKVRFYEYQKVKSLLLNEVSTDNPSNDQLFAIAMRYANGKKDSRVDDFNANYALSRAILTTVLISTILMLIKNYNDWRVYAITLPILFGVWLRCKQRAYYYAREILNEYHKQKSALS